MTTTLSTVCRNYRRFICFPHLTMATAMEMEVVGTIHHQEMAETIQHHVREIAELTDFRNLSALTLQLVHFRGR